MNILLITQKADRNDPVLGFTHAWFERLAARLSRLHLLVLAEGDHSFPDNVSVTSMGKESGAGRAGRLVRFARTMMSLVWTRRVDAVFVHMCPIYAVLAAPFCRLRNVPLVMWITHGADNPTLRLAHRLVDKVVTASPESCALRSPKVVSTGHGIDVSQFSPAGDAKPGTARSLKLLSVGRVSRVKDYATLIKAAGELARSESAPDFSITIVGACYNAQDEEYKKELDALIKEQSLDGAVTFTGAVPHSTIQDFYRDADLFVSTSLTGSIDKAVLEAMASGVASITCNPSFKRVFGDLAPALMFEPGDVSGLAARIRGFLESPLEQRCDLAEKLETIVADQHGIEILMDRLVLEMKKSKYEKTSASPRTRWIVEQVRGRRILDVGFAGTGFPFLHYFIKDANPDSEITGCDLVAEKILACRFVTAAAGDAMHLPFRDNTFDCAVFAEIYEHLLEPVPALRELCRVLKPGGRLVFSTPSAAEPFRWARSWLLPRRLHDKSVYRYYLADEEHVQFPDPLSLLNVMDACGLRPAAVTTKNHRIPLLGRISRRAHLLDLRFFPADRLGSYLCIVAEKKN